MRAASGTTDRFGVARTVADAVLYEGYVLYPYRASARKNQLRWQFGVLAPPAYAAAEGSERSAMRTEVLVDPGGDARVSVRIRCLQVQQRRIEAARSDGEGFEPADSVDVDGARWVPWAEAVDHELDLDPIDVLPVSESPEGRSFVLAPSDRARAAHHRRGRRRRSGRAALRAGRMGSCGSPPRGRRAPPAW